jgi:hypothetical protein
MLRMERISGPFKGFFIAAYSVMLGGVHVGYAKVCKEQPQSVWSETEVEKLTSAAGCRSELEAVAAAEQKARASIVQGGRPTT